MTWVRVDDGFFEHPKTLAVGEDAAYLFLAGLAYCNKNLTDGMIPKAMLRRLTAKHGRALAAKLCAVLVEGKGPYWYDRGEHYESHEYLAWNESRATILARRERDRKRKQESDGTPRGQPDGIRVESTPESEGDSERPLHSAPSPLPSVGGTPRPPDPPEPAGAPPARRERGTGAVAHEPKSAATWTAYADAFQARYRTPPVRNRKTNALLCQLVDRLGAEEAPLVAAWYVGHPHARYVQAGHAVWALVQDAEKLRTEWATGHVVTATQARSSDRLAATGQWAADLLAENQARRFTGDPDASE